MVYPFLQGFNERSFLLLLLRGIFEGPMISDAFLQATIARASSNVPSASARALIQHRENPIS